MAVVHLRFYEELNDFLAPARRKQDFTAPWRERTTVKDMIESVGVPHTEVDLILVNSKSVDFSYILLPGDRISIYPQFESFDISSLNRLRPVPLRVTRFILDTHLGKLARYLRLLGFDALYDRGWDDEQLARLAATGERRILLTRDHGLLKRKQVTHGYFVRSDQPPLQIREVLRRFDLFQSVQPFKRCTRCNGVVQSVDKGVVLPQLPRGVAERCEEFTRCPVCLRIYWKGSHYDHMQRIIAGVRERDGEVHRV